MGAVLSSATAANLRAGAAGSGTSLASVVALGMAMKAERNKSRAPLVRDEQSPSGSKQALFELKKVIVGQEQLLERVMVGPRSPAAIC